MQIKEIFDSFTYGNILTERVVRSDSIQKSASYSFSESAAARNAVALVRPQKTSMRAAVGKEGPVIERIGPHPDFAHLTADETVMHYAVSAFVDIKGSTLLGTKLPLEEVRFIKNGILTTAIDFFQIFDGHVHRLQGDAIFAFFGGRGVKKADAIIDALNATSFLQSYFTEHLTPAFEAMGFPRIKIRVGLDFGDDDKVLWSSYGIQDCCEITTTSIHTDLAAKMQGRAHSNTTMIGDNIVKFLDLPREFYKVKTYKDGGVTKEDRYIIDSSDFRYGMWQFDWDRYLNRFALLPRAKNTYRHKSPEDFQVRCYYRNAPETGFNREYFSNCGSLPKGVELQFSLTANPWVSFDNVIWEVNNRGTEAEGAGKLDFVMAARTNEIVCPQLTAYKGHHYMKCTLKQGGVIVGEEYFGIYVS